MTSGNGSGGRFQVHCAKAIADSLKELQRSAAEAGAGVEALAAIRRINERLKHGPREFGEPLYHLQGLRLTVFVAIVAPLVVEYAVHDDQPIVFIRGFKAMPGSGF